MRGVGQSTAVEIESTPEIGKEKIRVGQSRGDWG
jgi:hypothetical protein